MEKQAVINKNRFKKKRIAVSEKRQITIPLEFYKRLDIENEVDCYLDGASIVLQPVQEDRGEFDEYILADLINQGFTGQDLLDKFKETRRKIRPAILKLLNEAELAAGEKADYTSYSELFSSEDK